MEVHFVSQHIRAYIGLHNLDESCLFSREHGKVAKIFSLLNSSSNKEMNERKRSSSSGMQELQFWRIM